VIRIVLGLLLPIVAFADTVQGRFVGLEQGDYTYLRVQADGQDERSLMVLTVDDPTLEILLDDPDRHIGRIVNVTFDTRLENIPEAGGEIEVDVVRAVAIAKDQPKSALAKSTSHCTTFERTAFNCVAGERVISVCTTIGGGPTYRFGRLGAIELSYPKPDERAKAKILGGSFPLSGGGGATLRFVRGNFGYVVYSAITRDGERAGVLVERDGKPIANPRCDAAIQTELGPDWFTEHAIAPETAEFLLPE
jgi:hypothetical protein